MPIKVIVIVKGFEYYIFFKKNGIFPERRHFLAYRATLNHCITFFVNGHSMVVCSMKSLSPTIQAFFISVDAEYE